MLRLCHTTTILRNDIVDIDDGIQRYRRMLTRRALTILLQSLTSIVDVASLTISLHKSLSCGIAFSGLVNGTHLSNINPLLNDESSLAVRQVWPLQRYSNHPIRDSIELVDSRVHRGRLQSFLVASRPHTAHALVRYYALEQLLQRNSPQVNRFIYI